MEKMFTCWPSDLLGNLLSLLGPTLGLKTSNLMCLQHRQREDIYDWKKTLDKVGIVYCHWKAAQQQFSLLWDTLYPYSTLWSFSTALLLILNPFLCEIKYKLKTTSCHNTCSLNSSETWGQALLKHCQWHPLIGWNGLYKPFFPTSAEKQPSLPQAD